MKTINKKFLIFLVVTVVLGAWYLNRVKERSAVEFKTDIVTEESGYFVSGTKVEYLDGVKGYLAEPSESGEYPGLILIHEWWGLNDNIRDLAMQYAGEGYIALAVDLYGGESTTDPSKARELATKVRGDMDGAFANLTAAVEFLKTQPNIKANRLASVGWCFGGGWSYEMAKNDLGVTSSVIYYGRFNPEDDLSIMRATIMGHFGEKDQSILVDDVKQFRIKLKTLSGEHEVFIYPNAGHAFDNQGGPAYNQGASDLAWERTKEFLKESLRGD